MADLSVAATPMLMMTEPAERAANELDKQLKKACQQQSDNPFPAGWLPPLPMPVADKPPLTLPRSAALKLSLPVADHQAAQMPASNPSGLQQSLLAKIGASRQPQQIALKPKNELPTPAAAISQQQPGREPPIAISQHIAIEAEMNRELSPAIPPDKSRLEEKRPIPIPTGLMEKNTWQPELNNKTLPTSAPSRLPEQPAKHAAASEAGNNSISYAFNSWGDKHRVQISTVRDVNQQLAVVINPSDPLVSKRLHEAINSQPPTTAVIFADQQAEDEQQRRQKQQLWPGEDEE